MSLLHGQQILFLKYEKDSFFLTRQEEAYLKPLWLAK